MSTRVLITGEAGFIGSHAADERWLSDRAVVDRCDDANAVLASRETR